MECHLICTVLTAGLKMTEDDKPDYGDMVNDQILDDIAEVYETLGWCYEQLNRSGWYGLVKHKSPNIAKMLLKFTDLYRPHYHEKQPSKEPV